MTFKEYVDGINKMAEEHPECLEMEMCQMEHWDDEEVSLPEVHYPYMSLEDPKVYI